MKENMKEIKFQKSEYCVDDKGRRINKEYFNNVLLFCGGH